MLIARKTLRVLIVTAMCCAICSHAHADNKRRAVIVGVASFEHGYASLDYTARDARRTATALEDLGYSVSLLAADADAGEVKYGDVLGALNSAAHKSEPGDTLLFFFAGHGSRRMNKDYLLLSDSDPDKFDSTALALDTLSQIVAGSKATKHVFVIDACRSSSRADGKTGFDAGKLDKGFKDALDKLTQKAGSTTDVQTAVLYACSPGETSKESVEERSGIFTQRFVQALQQAPKPLTLGSILRFVKTHMPPTLEQNPLLVGSADLSLQALARAAGVVKTPRELLHAPYRVNVSNPQLAMQQYRDLMTKSPQDYSLTMEAAAFALTVAKNDAEAVRLCQSAAMLQPNNAEPYNLLGYLYLYGNNARNPGEAEKCARRAVEIDPNDAYAWLTIGDILGTWTNRDWAEAERMYIKVVTMDPQFSEAYENLGWLYKDRKKDSVAAAKFFEQARRTNSGNLFAYLGLALVEIDQAKISAAEQTLLDALAVKPNNINPYWDVPSLTGVTVALARLYLNNKKDYVQAERFLRRAIALDPNDASLKTDLGKALAAQGK